MTTPICDFVRRYAQQKSVRLHMPGHKGANLLGFEQLDITEIDGADSLYEAGGIIAQSEKNASLLFGCDTFYSTEGSSQCIRAMLYLACLGKQNPVVFAARNAHKTFLSAAALLDFDVKWLYGTKQDSYLCCDITPQYLDSVLAQTEAKPAAVYITSPDYLGNVADIKGLAQVCHSHGTMLVVDNAHGAYLKFLNPSQQPVDLGADLCCDSAHKTLPVVTGGAYLHISGRAAHLSPMAKNALALFGSTSPSYLILQSLDMANRYIAEGFSQRLATLSAKVSDIKQMFAAKGLEIKGTEPTKITLATKSYGYTGTEFAQLLAEKNIVCEFCDPDFVVFMFTDSLADEQLQHFAQTVCKIPPKAPITQLPPPFVPMETVMTARCASFAQCEQISVHSAAGRILAAATVGCPPAVPIVVCGEKIAPQAIKCFEYYGIDSCVVVKQ